MIFIPCTDRLRRTVWFSVLVLASCLMGGFRAQAHPGHHLAQAESESQDGGRQAVVVEAVPDEPSQVDRQIAFFEYEMLMHLALRAPTPAQQQVIDLGLADQKFAERDPLAVSLSELKKIREPVLPLLRSDYAVRTVEWTGDAAELQSTEPLEMAVGLPRTVLVDFANASSNFVDISCRQTGHEEAPATKYTVHLGRSTLVPVIFCAKSLDETSLGCEVTIHGKTQETVTFTLPVKVRKAAKIRGTVIDSDLQQPWPGRVYVLGSDRMYRHGLAYANIETLSQKELLQFWNMGRYHKLPFFYSDGTFEIDVPPGETKLTLERGFEHEVVSETINLQSGETREIELASGRIRDMKKLGWVSGDTHVHWVTNQWNVDLPLELLATVQRAEDLRVANNLTLLQRGPTLAFINPSQAPMGTVAEFSDSEFHIEMGEEYRNEDLYGHLCFLNLDWLVQPIGTGSIIAGPDALDYPINKTAILACREQGGISCEAHGLGGNKDVPVNIVHGLTDSLDQIHPFEYYDFLDCGFHLPLTNGSDHPARVMGCARAYIKVDGEFSYERWIEGIRQCRTFTTSGPLLFLTVNDSEIGDTLEAKSQDELRIHAEAVSRYPIGNFQIISNGEVIAEKHVPGTQAELEITIPAGESRWVVARCSPTDNYNALQQENVAHTSAIYVDVDGLPRFLPSAARRWIVEMEKHIRDIRTKGRFANDSQMQEAIDYVEAGIRRYEDLIRQAEGRETTSVESNTKPFQLVSESKGSPWPGVNEVEPQPALVHLERLSEALDYIGNPLPKGTKAQLTKLQQENDGKRLAESIQELLDPLCLAAVEISDGKLSVAPQPGEHEVIQKGWRAFLIKVCNRDSSESRLRVESPNARSLPHAKQSDLAARWLGLMEFDGRSMKANLSGDELEYRIVLLYSRDEGKKQATLDFSIDSKPGQMGRQIREWRFDEGTDGWRAESQCEIEAKDGSLFVNSTGFDPFIVADVAGATGKLVLRFKAETDKEGVGEIFWWTEERPAPDANRAVQYPIIPGGAQVYTVELPVEGVLLGVRIDPTMKRGVTRIDWIDLSYVHKRGETLASVPLKFNAIPAVPITLKIVDKAGEPAAAALDMRDHLGRVYPDQSKRLAPDMFFHPQVYRLDGENVYLPSGKYKVKCWRGPHSIPEMKELVVGDEPMEFEIRINRWIDPAEHGWWSGDHHIHGAGCLHYVNPTEGIGPSDMVRQCMGEDLNVGCCLNWMPNFDYQKRFFTGRVDDVSRYPYLIRYDIEVSGYGSHVSGHLNLLNLKEQIPPGGDSKDHWPTLGLNTLRWAKKQGAVCGPAHSAHGLTDFVGRLENYEDGPDGLPHYKIPAFDGIGANEYIVDLTHELPGPDGKLIPAIDFISAMDTSRQEEWNMWYHTLNCGFRVRVSGETDYPCMTGDRVGFGRVYVRVDDELTFENWINGIQEGRSYVSDGRGHLIDFEAKPETATEFLRVGDSGSEIAVEGPTTIQCKAKCAVRLDPKYDPPGENVKVELIVNGFPVAETKIPADGTLQDVAMETTLDRSSWVAFRVYPHAHTNPFFVLVDDKPIRASKASAEWCLRCVDQCWLEKEQSYDLFEKRDAKDAYEHARRTYAKILAECEE